MGVVVFDLDQGLYTYFQHLTALQNILFRMSFCASEAQMWDYVFTQIGLRDNFQI